MAEKIKYALSGEEQRKEMTIIANCWDQLSKLDTHARVRALDWLRSWTNAEAPEHRSDMDF